MTQSERAGELTTQLDALEESMSGTQAVASAFSDELSHMRASISDTGKQVKEFSSGISRGLRNAFDSMIFDGMKMEDAFKNMARSMSASAYNSAMTPVTNQFGTLAGAGVSAIMGGILPNATGNSFSQGRVMPFAKGGVVSAPTMFPMRGATGLMGEAGPEAIMPLTRGPDGSLGVRTHGGGGGGPVNVVMNISTPDADSFRRSQGQVAAQMSRALGRGSRNR